MKLFTESTEDAQRRLHCRYIQAIVYSNISAQSARSGEQCQNFTSQQTKQTVNVDATLVVLNAKLVFVAPNA